MQQRILFGDEADALAYWQDKEWKKWAVDITAGPAKRPTYRYTMYVRARDAEGAVECAQRNALSKPPRGARWVARLTGPRELGCVPTPAKNAALPEWKGQQPSGNYDKPLITQ